MTKIKNLVVLGSLGLLLMGCSSAPEDVLGDTVVSASPTAEPAPEAIDYATPEDFEISLVMDSKQCFGTAGCNVTVIPELSSDEDGADWAQSYSVTFEIVGGEDTYIDTIELDSSGYYEVYPASISTASESAELSAHVVSVRY